MTGNEIYEVKYTKISNGETSTRTIIPTFVPSDIIKAIDITGLTTEDQQEMRTLLQEYDQYKKAYMTGMFDFATFVEHTTGKAIEPKYRSFVQDNLQVL